jgi:hypothetical protein
VPDSPGGAGPTHLRVWDSSPHACYPPSGVLLSCPAPVYPYLVPSLANHRSSFPAAGQVRRSDVPTYGRTCSSYQYDPRDPCPSYGGNVFGYKVCTTASPLNTRTEPSPDVLSFVRVLRVCRKCL